MKGKEITGELVYIPIDKLYPHPDNPRKELGDLTELADSIKAKGVLQNLTVVPKPEGDGNYTVIIGHRRTAAAKQAGLDSVPCIITEMTDKEQVATMLLENMQRSDLTVYEQAQGFQMMIDLGESVETVSEKTGFSKTTVRRRLKMAELDPEKLKEVSSRQLTLEDFDALSKIEDLAVRNEVLDKIGTSNFEYAVKSSIKKQNIAKNLPRVKEWIGSISAKEINSNERYSGKYKSEHSFFVNEVKEEELCIPKELEGKNLFYYLDESYGQCSIYTKIKKEKVEVSEEEKARKKLIAEARAEYDEICKTSYECRRSFAEGLRFKKISDSYNLLQGAIMALFCGMFYYSSVSKDDLCKHLGTEWDYGHSEESKKLLKKAVFETDIDTMTPLMIYLAFGDKKSEGYASDYKQEYPKWRSNDRLDMLYKWLTFMGYEMSDEEKAMQDGTHELFKEQKE